MRPSAAMLPSRSAGRAAHDPEAHHRQQELFVLVVPAVDRLKVAGIPFDEEVISLYVEGSKEQILEHSPAGKVPILIDGDVRVWELLAILEYVAEKFPDAGLWPSDAAARAHARAISTEMHAGFAPLRSECGMNIWRPPAKRDARRPTRRQHRAHAGDLDARRARRFGAGGPFLFGKFSAADAMYAPVVSALRDLRRSTSPRRSRPTCRR